MEKQLDNKTASFLQNDAELCVFDELKQQNLGDLNPKFREASYELHFPKFSYEAYSSTPQHQSSLIHEYYHLIQALTTVHGMARFILVSERLTRFFGLIRGRNKIYVPTSHWIGQEPENDALRKYSEYRRHYDLMVLAMEGRYAFKLTEIKDEFTVLSETVPGPNGPVNRYHLTRNVGSDCYAVPILGDVISEAQAETMGSYFANVESPILAQGGAETEPKACLYTTLPAAIALALPDWPLAETIFLLTDLALMTFAPDHTFLKTVRWLKTSKQRIPTNKSEWQNLYAIATSSIAEYGKSDLLIREDLRKRSDTFARHANGHEAIRLFVERLELGKKTLDLRRDDPMHFFPWERTAAYIDTHFLDHAPVPFAKFSDGIRSMGRTNDQQRKDQAILTGAEYLRSSLEDGTNEPCPYINDKSTCTAQREYECSSSPWSRGDIGSGLRCPIGYLGTSLGIEKAEIALSK